MHPPEYKTKRPKGDKDVSSHRLQVKLHTGHIRIVRETSKPMQTFLEMFRVFPTPYMKDGPDALE